MKKKTIIGAALGVATLALAGTATALSFAKKATEVKAGTSRRLYLDMSGFADWYKDSATFKLKTHNNGNGEKYWPCTKVANAYYYVDVDLDTYAKGNGYEFIRYNSTGSTLWNEGPWNSYSSGTPNTYFKVSGWSAGTWSTADQKTWKVAGASSGTWTAQSEDIAINLTMRFNDEGLQFYSTSVTLAAGSVFKVQNVSGTNEYYGYDCMETNALTKTYLTGSGSGNITVGNGGGTFEVYMKPFTNKFWMQVSSTTEATTFSSNFLSATDSICSTGGTAADHSSALSGIWTAQTNAWNALTLGAKNAFKTGTANETISDAKARYVHIMGRYGETLTAFEDGPSYANSFIPKVVPTQDGSVATAMVVTAAVGVAATVGLFFIRKRKAI